MVLHQSDFLKIQYLADFEILEVSYADIFTLPVPVIKEQIGLIFQFIHSRNIEKLLFDSSKVVSALSVEESKEIAAFFYQELQNSNVKMVARISSAGYLSNATARMNTDRVKEEIQPNIAVDNFSDREDAIVWLVGWNQIQLT